MLKKHYISTLAVVLGMLTVAAPSALAAPATFSSSGPVSFPRVGTQVFTISKTGSPTTTVTCTGLVLASTTASNSGSPAQGSLAQIGFGGGNCRDAQNNPWYVLTNAPATSAALSTSAGTFAVGFSGYAFQIWKGSGTPFYDVTAGTAAAVSAAWTNGTSVANPSTLGFASSLLGTSTSGFQVRLSATYQVTQAGALITAIP